MTIFKRGCCRSGGTSRTDKDFKQLDESSVSGSSVHFRRDILHLRLSVLPDAFNSPIAAGERSGASRLHLSGSQHRRSTAKRVPQ